MSTLPTKMLLVASYDLLKEALWRFFLHDIVCATTTTWESGLGIERKEKWQGKQLTNLLHLTMTQSTWGTNPQHPTGSICPGTKCTCVKPVLDSSIQLKMTNGSSQLILFSVIWSICPYQHQPGRLYFCLCSSCSEICFCLLIVYYRDWVVERGCCLQREPQQNSG